MTLTKADTSTITYTVPFKGIALTNPATAAITGVTINGGTATSFSAATLSSPLNLAWSLPTGYSLSLVRTYGYVQNASGQQCSVEQELSASATSGQLNMPTTCGASAIVSGGINVTTEGTTSGQRSAFMYNFNVNSSGPVASLSTSSLTFGNVTVGQTSAAQTVTYTNSGNASLTLTSAQVTGTGFQASAGTCTPGLVLTAGQSCTVSVTFGNGASVGLQSGSITFTSDAPGSPHLVSLSGTMVAAPSGTTSTLFLRPASGTAVRVGETRNFFAVLTKADGTIINPVSGASFSVTSGPATVDSSGNVTGTATASNATAVVQATYSDATHTNGQTVTATQTITVQASQDLWAATVGTVAQGGDVRNVINTGVGAILAPVFGGGIYRTTTGAAGWEQSSYGIPQTGSARVRALRGALSDGSIVAAVEGSGVYRSTNGGASWVSSNTGLSNFFPRGFGYRSSNNSLYVATTGGVYKSTNSGVNWALLSGLPAGTVNSVQAFSSSETVWAVVAGSGLYLSTDGGANWVARNNGIPLSNGVPQVYNFTAPPGVGNAHLAMVEGGGIYRSSDSGVNWVAQNNGLPAVAVNSYGFQGGISTPGDGYIYVAIDGYGIYRGTTGANTSNTVTWSAWGTTASQLPQFRVRPPSLVSGTYYVPTGQGVYASSDAGATWSAFKTGLPRGYVINTVSDPANTNIVYAAADTVYKSTDGGTTWAAAGSGITGAVSGGQRGSGGNLTRASDGTLYVSTANAGIFRSTDGAASWVPVNTGLPMLIGQGVAVRNDALSAQTVYALFDADSFGVWQSTNAGASWADISGDLPAGNARKTQEIARDPATGDLYLATNAGVYRSSNGGANWASIYSATGASHVRVDSGTSPSTVYWSTYVTDSFNNAQTTSGVYKSTDQGASSTQILSSRLINNLRVVRTGSLVRVYALSWNITSNLNQSRVLKSLDGGATWQSVYAGMPHAFVNSLDVVNNAVVRAATIGGGVYNFTSADILPPGSPTAVSASAGNAQATVSFTAPVSNGGATISGYTVTSSPGGITASGSASPITVTGLTNGTSYTFTVVASNSAGNSSPSTASNAVTPAAAGAPAVSLSTSTLNFGTVLVNQASANQTVTITNTGTALLTLSGGPAPVNFGGGSLTCTGTLAPGQSCDWGLQFLANATPGTYNGTLTFTSDAPGSPHVVNLTATVVASLPNTSTLFVRPASGTAVRVGETRNFFAVLTKADGTIINPVSGASFSVTSGPATVDSSGNVTGTATASNATAVVQATYSDATHTNGQTVTATQTITVQASQDLWAATVGTVAQGGDVRNVINTGVGAILAPVFGGGIYRTTTGAAGWEQSSYGIPQTGSARVRALRGALSDGSIVAAVEGSGVYRSTNGGASWVSSNTGLSNFFPRGFGYRSSNNSLYVATTGGVYKSTNSGVNWALLSGLPAGTVNSVQAFSSSETVWAVVAGSGLYLSTDGGANWVARNNGIPLSNGVPQVYNFTAPPGVGNAHLAMVEGGGIYRSSDSGVNWVAQNNGLPAVAVNSYGFQGGISTPGDGYIYVAIDGYGIYRGTTGANTSNTVTWSAWGTTASQLPQFRVRPPSLVSGTYYVPTGQGVYASSDAGATWSAFKTGLPRGYVINTVSDPANTNIVYAAADTVYKSTDGGTTWAAAGSGITGAVSGGQRGSGGNLTRASDGTLYVSTANAGIFRSTDGAASWVPVNTGLPMLIGQGVAVRNDALSAQTVYALFDADSFGVWQSTNAGASWADISGDLPAGNARKTQEIARDPATGDLYLATNAGVYRSSNGGANWASIYSATGASHVRVDSGTSPSTVYWSTYVTDSFNNAQTTSGVYKSTDQGASSTQILSSRLINNLRVVRTGSLVRVYALSWNITSNLNQSRVLKSLDGGATWQSVYAGMPHAFVNSLDVVNNAVVRAATIGGGVYNFTSADILPPGSPTAVSASAGNAQATVSFTAPVSNGGATISGYTVTSSPGGITASGSASPITVTGLTNGTSYTFTVVASNSAGNSSPSTASNAVTPAAAGAPAVSLSTSTLNFGNVTVGQTSSAQSVTVTNSGTATLNFSLVQVTGTGFAATSNACIGALNAGQSCIISVTFGNGASAGVQSGSIGITSNAPGSPHAVSLSGTMVAAGGSSITINDVGFNLLGNTLSTTINVPSAYGTADSPVAGLSENIASIWKWDASVSNWQFHSPLLSAAQNTTFINSKGYAPLVSIAPGEGYWVNVLAAPLTLPSQSGSNFSWNAFTFANLVTGFNLIAHSGVLTPSQFNSNMSAVPPSPGVIPTDNFLSLWVWDAAQAKWYFYSPLLESSGGLPAVKTYADSHFFLHFQDFGKTIGPHIGFWVLRP